MLPNLKPRQHVLSIATKKIKKNDLVIIQDSLKNKVIKRVCWIEEDKFKVISDNKDLTFSPKIYATKKSPKVDILLK